MKSFDETGRRKDRRPDSADAERAHRRRVERAVAAATADEWDKVVCVLDADRVDSRRSGVSPEMGTLR